MKLQISGGLIHPIPSNLEKSLFRNDAALAAWQDISAIARNEWICWIVSAKLEKTQLDHIKRTVNELAEGKRRPCCWIGCIHRTDKPVGTWAQKVSLNKNISASRR